MLLEDLKKPMYSYIVLVLLGWFPSKADYLSLEEEIWRILVLWNNFLCIYSLKDVVIRNDKQQSFLMD